jgi:hypothetical protein
VTEVDCLGETCGQNTDCLGETCGQNTDCLGETCGQNLQVITNCMFWETINACINTMTGFNPVFLGNNIIWME